MQIQVSKLSWRQLHVVQQMLQELEMDQIFGIATNSINQSTAYFTIAQILDRSRAHEK